MAENLSETNKIVVRVSPELMRHRVVQEMGMQLDSGHRRILVANRLDASIRQRPPLAEKYSACFTRRPGFQYERNTLRAGGGETRATSRSASRQSSTRTANSAKAPW